MDPTVFASQAEATSESLSSLAKYGPLGIFCVLLIVALVWTVKAWKAAMEARTADAKGYAEELKTHLQSVKDVGDAGAELAIQSNQAQGNTQATIEKLTDKCDDLKSYAQELAQANTGEHREVRESVDKLREKQVELVAAAKAAHASKKE